MSAGAGLVDGTRQRQHGDPVPNMERFAALIGAYFGIEASAHDAAMVLILFKACRSKANPQHMDNYDDIEGYTEIARRCVVHEDDEAAEAQRRTETMT